MQNHYYRRQIRRNCSGRSFVKTIAGIILLLPLYRVGSAYGTTYSTDGSSLDVQLKIILALDGDTVTLPPGNFTWSNSVNCSKAIKLQGGGSGRIIGDTKSSVAVGTGTKTFTTTNSGLPITTGETLRIARMPSPPGAANSSPTNRGTYMEGTVTNYSGTTLTMNITSTAGSGTWYFWWIATAPTTTIVNAYNNGAGNDNAATPLLNISQLQAGSAEISGIKFYQGPSCSSAAIGISRGDGLYTGPRTLIHDCWFQTTGGDTGFGDGVFSKGNRVLIWNCSFDDNFSEQNGALTIKDEAEGILPNDWNTNSTMGTADSDGTRNFYVEDCDFHGYLNVLDTDSAARMVVRYCTFDNAGNTSHGADTGGIGMRHVEIYNNGFIFDNFGDTDGSKTLPVAWWFWLRGGTGVFTGNDFPALTSTAWGSKDTVRMTVLNLWRASGGYPCWVGYPAPRQVGQGYGSGAVYHFFPPDMNYDDLDYYTYSEPVYIWNNTGTGASNNFTDNADPSDACGNGQDVSTYIVSKRDYYADGNPKPGYARVHLPASVACAVATAGSYDSAIRDRSGRRGIAWLRSPKG